MSTAIFIEFRVDNFRHPRRSTPRKWRKHGHHCHFWVDPFEVFASWLKGSINSDPRFKSLLNGLGKSIREVWVLKRLSIQHKGHCIAQRYTSLLSLYEKIWCEIWQWDYPYVHLSFTLKYISRLFAFSVLLGVCRILWWLHLQRDIAKKK